MTADDKYFLRNNEHLQQPIQMELSKKVKAFSEYFAQFLESLSNFNYFEKKITLVAYVFSKLQTVKCMIRQMSK